MSILVLGSVNIDETFCVDHIVKEGETIASLSISKSEGGKGANQAAALAKAGEKVFFSGKLGVDGLYILEKLKSYSVDISRSLVDQYTATGRAIIQIDKNGQNSIILSPGGNKQFTLQELTKVFLPFTAGDVLVLQNEINLVPEIIEKAKNGGMIICLNPSPFDPSILSWPLDLVDYFFINEIEASGMLCKEKIEETDSAFRENLNELAIKFPKATIIMTVGKKGAYCKDGEGIHYAPIVDYPVVDTTGAGDTFCGYFLSSYLKNKDAQLALNIASVASGLAVSIRGAMSAIPTKSEVEAALLDLR